MTDKICATEGSNNELAIIPWILNRLDRQGRRIKKIDIPNNPNIFNTAVCARIMAGWWLTAFCKEFEHRIEKWGRRGGVMDLAHLISISSLLWNKTEAPDHIKTTCWEMHESMIHILTLRSVEKLTLPVYMPWCGGSSECGCEKTAQQPSRAPNQEHR